MMARKKSVLAKLIEAIRPRKVREGGGGGNPYHKPAGPGGGQFAKGPGGNSGGASKSLYKFQDANIEPMLGDLESPFRDTMTNAGDILRELTQHHDRKPGGPDQGYIGEKIRRLGNHMEGDMLSRLKPSTLSTVKAMNDLYQGMHTRGIPAKGGIRTSLKLIDDISNWRVGDARKQLTLLDKAHQEGKLLSLP